MEEATIIDVLDDRIDSIIKSNDKNKKRKRSLGDVSFAGKIENSDLFYKD